MKTVTLISHSVQLLGIIFKSSKPADKIASEYFRSKKYIGSRERKFISELTFFALRNYYLCEYTLKEISLLNNHNLQSILSISEKLSISMISFIIWDKIDKDNAIYLLNLLNLQQNNNFGNLEEAKIQILNEQIEKSDNESIEIIDLIYSIYNNLENKVKVNNFSDELIEHISIKFSVNTFIIKSLLSYLAIDKVLKLLVSLTFAATLVVRINETAQNREIALKYFEELKIPCSATKYSPVGINIHNRMKLDSLELFKAGIAEVQDEGSQIITYALSPSKNSRILDACAGAGGKTLHIASMTNDKSVIIASDIDNRKLAELLKRSRRFGFQNITTVHIHPKKFLSNEKKDFKKQFDYILIDAPCSGSGTVRRMPMPKYRLNEKLIQRLQDNQFNILNYYSQFLKVNGILVYSTCSVLPQENQDVVNKFLSDNPNFTGTSIKEEFDQYHISLPDLNENDFMFNLFPSEHGTDGFFIARFVKESL
jgi:16S rRNA (cytosine967-C5)-methyltransferase